MGDGSNFYAVDGFQVTEAAVPALFDLTAKQIANSLIRESGIGDVIWMERESFPGERALEKIGLVYSEGDLFMALGDLERGVTGKLRGTGALLLIHAAALKPLKKDEEYRRFYLRDHGQVPAVAVYGDLMCDALLTPMAPGAAAEILTAARRAAALPLWAPKDEDAEAGT